MEETSGLKERRRKFPPLTGKGNKKGIRSNKDKTKINISFWSWKKREQKWKKKRRRREKKRRKKERKKKITGMELRNLTMEFEYGYMSWVVGNYEYLYVNMGVWNLGMVLYGTC